MKCALCGLEFDETAVACHVSCVFAKHCTVICCPGCGYQTPDTSRSRLARSLRRVLNGQAQTQANTAATRCRLCDMAAGKCGKVVAVNAQNDAVAERLMIMGILPGCDLTLVQRRPAIVVRAGYTELSLEDDVAQGIMVEVSS